MRQYFSLYRAVSQRERQRFGWFWFKGPLRQYFSLYRAISQREGERGKKGEMRVKMSKQPPPAPTASAVGPCPTVIQIVGRPGTGSFPAPSHHPTTPEGERGERIDESKKCPNHPHPHLCKRNRPLPYCNHNCRTPRNWKFTQHHRTTRPAPGPI